MNTDGILSLLKPGISKEKEIVLCIRLKGYSMMLKKLCTGLLDMKIVGIRISLKLKIKDKSMRKTKGITLTRIKYRGGRIPSVKSFHIL